MRHDNLYLYGDVEVPEIDSLVVARRIELLKENLEELMQEHYFTRDTVRCNAIIKAIEFWYNINNKDK